VARRPAPPKELAAIGQGKGVLLSWKPDDLSHEVKEYHVYRIINDVNSFLPLGTCPAEKITYLDEPLEIDSSAASLCSAFGIAIIRSISFIIRTAPSSLDEPIPPSWDRSDQIRPSTD
jgi:hypothetical protein